MHFKCEIVMPMVADVQKAVTEIMGPFNENADNQGGYAFWDFWVIGGRYSGGKLLHALGEERVNAFYDQLKVMGVTVSAFTAGKQSLQPESQIPGVDALWRDMFPDSCVDVCPLFAHSNDQYSSESILYGDILPLAQVRDDYTCCRLIFAGLNHDGTGYEAKGMFQEDFWNGVDHARTTWDMTFGAALREYEERISGYREEYKETIKPKPDWVVVTVDYHS